MTSLSMKDYNEDIDYRVEKVINYEFLSSKIFLSYFFFQKCLDPLNFFLILLLAMVLSPLLGICCFTRARPTH